MKSFLTFLYRYKSLPEYTYRSSALLLVSMLLAACSSSYSEVTSTHEHQWQDLLANGLKDWEIWMGVPHSSVEGLPNGTFTSENIHVHGNASEALGLNRDVKNVFNLTKDGNEDVLYVTGEIYGGVNTKASYENYHLQMQVKWGDKKWAPRLTKKRDSGLLFHCNGAHGVFWRTWKACQEFQIQETDFGDYIPLAGPTGKIRTQHQEGEYRFHPEGRYTRVVKGYSHAYTEPDRPQGEWNTVDLYVFEDKAVFSVNEEVVMVVTESRDEFGNPLTSGQIQLQSEGAEVYFKQIRLRKINGFPGIIEQHLN